MGPPPQMTKGGFEDIDGLGTCLLPFELPCYDENLLYGFRQNNLQAAWIKSTLDNLRPNGQNKFK